MQVGAIACIELINVTLKVSGAVTANFSALMMECVQSEVGNRGARVAQYTICFTTAVLGKFLFPALSTTALTDALEYLFAYCLVPTLSILPFSFLTTYGLAKFS
ncbi:hypothetical protein TcWFU_010193 [Taenia crassiceps]|uniref:Uncharacterized protein n=1 Tax=Taenia crassiceps TaxID=6207 RepID=A0ABR4QUR4_9CEST